MPPHVVVTGAGGFAGGFIARWLAARGMAVTAITRSSSLPAEQGTLAWRRADLREGNSLPAAFDALVHCAAEIPARCPDPKELYRRNVEAADSVFSQAAAARARSVIFLSSMSVYGAIAVPEVSEDAPPHNPDPYGRAKRDSEDALEGLVKKGIEAGLSIRLPGTVGRGSHHNFLSDSFARILAGETVHARNPDAMFNNIVYVGDLAEFIADHIGAPRAGYAVINLAAREPILIRDVYSFLFSRVGKPETIVYDGDGKGAFTISIDRALALGYRAPTVRQSLESFARAVVSTEGP